MNTDCHEKINYVPYSMHAPFPSGQVLVVQADQVQLFSTARDQIKNPRDMLLGYGLPWEDDATVMKW